MRTTPAGIALIKRFEGCELTAYQDPVGIWTIGYGCTHGVGPGDMISQAEADIRLIHDICEFEALVLGLVVSELTDNQLSALVSFVYNVGLGHPGQKSGFQYLIGGAPSTLIRLLNAGEMDQAANQFGMWVSAGGKPFPGLVTRRNAEKQLFLTPDEPEGASENEYLEPPDHSG